MQSSPNRQKEVSYILMGGISWVCSKTIAGRRRNCGGPDATWWPRGAHYWSKYISVCNLCTQASRLPPGFRSDDQVVSGRTDAIHRSFPGHNICFATPYIPGFAKTYKYDIPFNAYEHSDFPTVGGDIYRSRTSINQRLTGSNRRGKGRCVD
jgi:hypothetical protein